MIAEATLEECCGRNEHDDSGLRAFRQAVPGATEPSVRRYLQEALCCFAVGSYRAAYVMGWCAIAQHLRIVVRAIGVEIAQCYYRDEENKKSTPDDVEDWDGNNLLRAVEGLGVFDSKIGEFRKLYLKRCKCAHPSSVSMTSGDVINLLSTSQWLLQRDVSTERIGGRAPRSGVGIFWRALTKKHLILDRDLADRLVKRISEEQHVTLGINVIDLLFSHRVDREEPERLDNEPRQGSRTLNIVGPAESRPVDRRMRADELLWILVGVRQSGGLGAEGRSHLMGRLNEVLAPRRTDEALVDPHLGARFDAGPVEMGRDVVMWDSLGSEHVRVWEYFVEVTGEEDRREQITQDIARQYLVHAPEEFRKRMAEAWPQL